jgi:hypothetical protein
MMSARFVLSSSSRSTSGTLIMMIGISSENIPNCSYVSTALKNNIVNLDCINDQVWESVARLCPQKSRLAEDYIPTNIFEICS